MLKIVIMEVIVNCLNLVKKEFGCIGVIKWWGMLGNLRREGIVML